MFILRGILLSLVISAGLITVAVSQLPVTKPSVVKPTVPVTVPVTAPVTSPTIDQKCIKVDTVEGAEESFVDKFGQAGLYNVLSHKLLDWKSTANAPDAPPTDDKAKKKRCWKVSMKTVVGPFDQLTTTCTYYNDVAKETCNLDTSGTSLSGIFKHYGTFNIVLTDNRNYIVVYACLLGSRNYFLTLKKTPVLDKDLEDKVIDYFVNQQGLDKENLNYNSTDEMSIQKIQMIPCPINTNNTGIWPWPRLGFPFFSKSSWFGSSSDEEDKREAEAEAGEDFAAADD